VTNPLGVRKLGKTNINVFTIGLGAGQIGKRNPLKLSNIIDVELAIETLIAGLSRFISLAKEKGYTDNDAKILLDTAALYGDRRSEEAIGKTLELFPHFKPWVLVTTKTGNNHSGIDYSLDSLLRSIEKSQELTGISRFKIIYLHDAMELPEEVVYNAREELERRNVADFIGFAANMPNTSEQYLGSGLFPAAVLPESVSLINRRIDLKLIDSIRKYNIGIVAATVLEKGLLTDSPPSNILERNFSGDCLTQVDKIRYMVRQNGFSMTSTAMQWPLCRYPEIATCIAGPQSPEQAIEIANVFGKPMSEELFREVNAQTRHFEGQRIFF
jgi:aryl-alcohol dehydrogenase-like predicted oxidoreductase